MVAERNRNIKMSIEDIEEGREEEEKEMDDDDDDDDEEDDSAFHDQTA